MKSSLVKSLPRILTGAVAALVCTAASNPAHAATFTWGGVTGNFTDGTKWVGGTAPLGTDPTDILVFAGDVGTVPLPTSYIATNNGLNPFLINQLNFQGASGTPGTGPVDTINGTTLLFGGTNPTITQSGSASLLIDTPVKLGANLIFAGNTVANDAAHDKAMITINGTVSGNYNITKNGTSTFRFGSIGATAVSDNTWFGTLTINDGTIRFNNNAYTAPTALRANPVVLNSATALLTTQFKIRGTAAGQDPDSSLRFGTLSGTGGVVEARRETATANVFDSVNMTITTLSSGTFAGTLRNVQTGGINDATLNIRGVGTQTFTGTLDISKDVTIGDASTMVIAGNATLTGQTAGAIILGGGTLKLDNSTTNLVSRIRDGSSTSTGVETIGGGTISLIGNSAGGTETVGRLQLGGSQPRSGAARFNVTHSATTALTVLNFQSYARDNPGLPMSTVNFTANNAAGAPIALGIAGTSGARITFSPTVGAGFTVPVINGLIANTAGGDATSVGWATVNGSDFASYGANGIAAVANDAIPAVGGNGTNTANIALTANLALTSAGGYAVNSVKMAPATAGQTLDLANTGNLFTNAFLLAGTTDFAITSTGGGAIANAGASSARYFHVASAMLTVDASVNGAQAPLVKSGAGALVLTNSANNLVTQPVVINEGTLRATPGTSLPSGELRFRGGVLEITGGGTFSRQLGLGNGKLTWSGIDSVGAQIGQEQGSGGFAAVGSDAIVDLTPVSGTDFTWEEPGFVNSGHALVFGSTRATAKITWVDNIVLTATGQVVNYNARQFRAIDNPNSTTDVAVLSGTISGTVRNDLLKTGNGELILTGNNTYSGATLITDGTLRMNGSATNSFLTDVRDGGTLGGSGTVAGVQVESNGTIAPGDFRGNASILNTADLAFTGAGAKLAIELGGTTAGGNAPAGHDRVNVTGGVTLAGAQLNGSLINGFTAAATDLFFIIINDGADPVQGAFAQGALVTIGAQLFSISYTGNFTGTPATSTFTGGNDVVLRVVPEPGTATLLLLGMLGFGFRRRRA